MLNTRNLLTSTKIKETIAFLFLFMLMLTFISAFLPQAQIFVLEGRVVLPTLAIKAVIIVLLLISLFWVRNNQNKEYLIENKWMITLFSLFYSYLVLTGLLFIKYGLSTSFVVYTMNSYYFFLLIIPFVVLMNERISGEKIVLIFLAVSIPLSILGLVQYFFNSPIIPLKSSDGQFSVNSWQFGNRVRSFSLFDSGLDFGHYLSLCVSFIVAMIGLKKGNLVLKIAMIILLTVTAYTTLTRNIYIEYFSVILSVTLITKFLHRRIIALLPVVLYLGGWLINNIAPIMANLYHQTSVFNLETYISRQNEWLTVKQIWFDQGFVKALFGTGFIQSDKYAITKNLLIDNSFLAVGLHTGLVGLVFYILIMWSCWMYCLKITQLNTNVFNLGLTGFMSTWALTGIFNINIATYAAAFILFLLGNTKRLQLISLNHYLIWKN